MLRKSRLSAAVAFALASAAVVATPVLAEEGQNVEKLQKIKVTGSRISRVDVEGATPVVSVTKAKIEQSGQQTVADYLKRERREVAREIAFLSEESPYRCNK